LLVPGREDGKVIQQLSFRCASSADLEQFIGSFLKRNVSIIRTVSHGNAVGVYFEDPDGNQVEVYWQTGIDLPQPFGKPVDLTASDEEIIAALT
jgi:hypothetical protein